MAAKFDVSEIATKYNETLGEFLKQTPAFEERFVAPTTNEAIIFAHKMFQLDPAVVPKVYLMAQEVCGIDAEQARKKWEEFRDSFFSSPDIKAILEEPVRPTVLAIFNFAKAMWEAETNNLLPEQDNVDELLSEQDDVNEQDDIDNFVDGWLVNI